VADRNPLRVTTVTLYSCVIAGFSRSARPISLAAVAGHDGGAVPGPRGEQPPERLHDSAAASTPTILPHAVWGAPCAGFWSKGVQMRWFIVSGVLALIPALCPVQRRLPSACHRPFRLRAVMLLLYTYPLKYFALGELTIFLIWGPIMIGGSTSCWPTRGAGTWRLPGSPSGHTASINLGSTSTSR